MATEKVYLANKYNLIRVVWAVVFAFLASIAISREPDQAPAIIAILGLVAILPMLAITPIRRIRELLLGGLLISLTIYPTARVVAPGNLPIYLTDILTGLLLASLFLQRDRPKPDTDPDVRNLIFLVFLFWIPSTIFSTLHEIGITGIVLEPVYILIRTLLSIGVFFVILNLIRDRRYLHLVLWSLVIGMSVTAFLSILNSTLPPNHPIQLFLDSLTPIDLARKIELYATSGSPIRSRALIGSVNAAGALMTMTWALCVGMLVSGEFKKRQGWLWVMLALGVLGVILTYSRSALISLALVIVTFIFRRAYGRRRTIAGVVLGVILLLMVLTLFGSAFDMDFVFEKFASIASFTTDTIRDSNTARIMAYVNMPGFLVKHPPWLVVGRGMATEDLMTRGLLAPSLIDSDIFRTENHSLLAITFYQRGLLAMLVLILIYVLALRVVTKRPFSLARRSRRAPPMNNWLQVTIQASLVGMLSPALFDHLFGSHLNMQALLFLFLGLAVVAHRFTTQAALENSHHKE
jgi:hypothetical protein